MDMEFLRTINKFSAFDYGLAGQRKPKRGCKRTSEKPRGYWTHEKIVAVALRCQDRTEFRQRYMSAYESARKQGILDKICSHMQDQPRGMAAHVRNKEEAKAKAKG